MNALTSRTRIVLISLALTILAACGGGGGGGGGGDTTDNQPIKVTAITITPQIASVSKGGESLQLTATAAPDNATNKAVTWTSSDDTIISVSNNGLLTANADSGNATVTATAQDGSGIKASITVNAVPNGSIKVTAITLSPQNPMVVRGVKTAQLTATFTPTNAANKTLAWTSSDTATISVSTAGLVTANVDTGSVTITATAQDGSGISGSTTVTALPPCTTAMPCLRVTSEAGSGNGASWTSPLSGLQAALDQAKTLFAQTSNPPSTVRIFLKGGTYRPSKNISGTACNADTTYSDCTFVMQNNVEIYGGFAGTETSLADRVLNASTTTYLDGLLNRSTTVTACATDTVNAKCSTRVINNSNYTATAPLTASAVVDGVVVRNGRSNDSGGGGGMFNVNASPTIRNVTFSGNTGFLGGGLYNYASSPRLTNVTFSGNTANNGGGGMYNENTSPILTNVTFSGNIANQGGGGLYNASASPLLINVTFSGNTAMSGGGLYNARSSFPLLTNVTFSGNSATMAGSKNVYNYNGSLPVFVNAVLWGDSIYNDPGSSIVGSSTVAGSSSTAYSSLIQGVAADTNGNLNGVSATTAGIFGNSVLADNGNPFAQTVAIAANSPALNNGALVWKSGDDYYASTSSNVFKLTGTGTGKVTTLPAGVTLISTGGANKNNTVTPTGGPPAVYPDLGAYQH